MHNKIMGLFSAVILSLLLISSNAFSAVPYLYANMPGGALGGGVGFDLSDGKAVDLSMSSSHSSTTSRQAFYADYFWSNWGIGATLSRPAPNADLTYDIGLQYELEHNLNEKVFIGITVCVLDYISAPGVPTTWALCGSFVPYVKLLF